MRSAVDDVRFWDRVARKYARAPIKDLAGYERTLDRTASLLRGSDTVLEVGCGTGTTALRLAPLVRRLIATDISGEMIKIAREKAAAGTAHNIAFEVAGADEVHGTENMFDAILAFSMLHLSGNLPSVFAGINHALKPGGLFISKTPCLAEINVLIKRAIPVMRLVGLAPSVTVISAQQLEALIEAQGFEIIERGRHGSTRRDFRAFIVARKPAIA